MNFAKQEAMIPLVAQCGGNQEVEKQAMVQRLTVEKWTPGRSLETRCLSLTG